MQAAPCPFRLNIQYEELIKNYNEGTLPGQMNENDR